MANLITLSRFPLILLILILFFWGGPAGQLVSVPLILILILMDSLDGYVARRYKQDSLLGSALDIATDRSVELVLWVTFAYLDMIPLLIPLIVIVRGTLTDSVRAVASSEGTRPFDMMRTPLSQFLVASIAMRSSYGIVKGFAFCCLALTLALSHSWGVEPAGSTLLTMWKALRVFSLVCSWLALILCVLRGLPVLIEAPAFLREVAHNSEEHHE